MINSKIHYHNFDEYNATDIEYGGPWGYLDNGIFTEDDLDPNRTWDQICSPYSKQCREPARSKGIWVIVG